MSAQPKEESCLLELAGRTLGSRFEVQQRFRCGSFAELFLARNVSPQPREPENVVIKALNVRLQGEVAADLERTLIENTQREARALGECQHESIVRLLDCGADFDNAGREFYYLVLEYLPGGNLARLLQTRRLTLAEALELLGQISAALTCIHQHGLVHRDVKPANVMLTANQRVAKLIDLGTVRWLDDDSGVITEVGTQIYAAPEHYSRARFNGNSLTVSADVYALGKTTYAILTGKQPSQFKQRSISSLPPSIAHEPWARPVLLVLSKATRDNPEDRHQSVAEFLSDLCEALEMTSYTARSSRTEEPEVAPGISRFVVDVTPLPKDPSRLGRGLTWVWGKLIAFARSLPARYPSYRVRLRRVASALPSTPFGGVGAVVILCLLILALGPRVFELARRMLPARPAAEAQRKNQADQNRFSATTDINIRQQPSASAPKIGLVEHDSVVRMLRRNQTQRWCEVEIIQHGRAKSDPTGAESGWVSCQFLSRES